jgi:SP family myo-inositol transporter-like MFS transporter 13
MFGFGILPAVLQLVLSFSLPESPRYLFRKGKNARGREVVKRLNPSWSSAKVQREVERLMNEVGSNVEGPERLTDEGDEKKWYERWMERLTNLRRIDWREKGKEWKRGKDRSKSLIWDDRANRKTLIVACGLQLFQQATGFNCLMY